MILDVPNLIAGGVIGFTLGVCANMLTARIAANGTKAELRRKYAGIAGDYTAFLFIKDNDKKETDKIDYDHPAGDCRITYEKENILCLHYQQKDQDSKWEAVVWMENPNFGTLAWRYIRLQGREPPAEHRFDFKRCIFSRGCGRDGNQRWYFYLLGNPPHGKEALEKK